MDWARGRGGSRCELPGPPPPALGVIPTLVIASSAGICDDGDHHDHKGVVFYGSEPVAWCCLTDGEIFDFKTWAATAFPSMQIVTVVSRTIINCPPLRGSGPDAEAAVRETMRNQLRAAATHWFVPATPTEATQLVA
jgi:hypothetical protein